MAHFPFRIVGFDLDGTLLDTHGDLGNALNHALAVHGLPQVPMQAVPALVGGGTRVMVERALAHMGAGPANIPAIQTDLVEYYRANISAHTRLFPGGEAMLDALEAEGAILALVTNKAEDLAVKLLGELGLSTRFGTIIGGDTLGPGRAKPAPDLLLEMLDRLGGGSAAYVGDTTFDVKAARAADLPVVACSFGFNDLPAAELGADAVIDHFDELLPALRSLS